MDLTPGAVIAGRYRVERKVGSGGMGEVWAGEHLTVGSRVAVKTLLSAAACNHEVVARFKREAYILGRIRSDHVARVVDFVADNDYGLVLVMEFIRGDSLSQVLTERLLSIEETIELGVDIASALVDLHQVHTIHRDLKPGNIILQPMHGERRRRAVVVDFGVSRLSLSGAATDEEEITGITRADMAVGTIEYMAPEQILNSRNVTSASDIYAAGAILFRAVAGKHVFGNIANDTELANKKLTTEPAPLTLPRADPLTMDLAAVIMHALKRRPSERYKTAQDLLNDLLPLRERARAVPVDVETTAVDQPAGSMLAMLPDFSDDPAASSRSGPALAPEAQATMPVRRSSIPSISAEIEDQLSTMRHSSVTTRRPSAELAAPRRGIPVIVLVAAVLGALVGGIALGAGFLQQKFGQTPNAPPTASTTETPSAPESVKAPAELVPPEAPSVAPVPSAMPSAARPAAPSTAPRPSAAGAVEPPSLSTTASPLPALPKPPKSPPAKPSAAPSATASAISSAEPSAKPAVEDPPDAATYY